MRSNRRVFVLAVALASALGIAGAVEVVWDSVIPLTTEAHNQQVGYGFQHGVAVDGSGNVHVAWLDQRDVPYQVWYRRYDAGQRLWQPEVALSNRPANCFQPGIACDSAGNVHVVWHFENWQGPGIWYKRFDAAAGEWRPDTLIDSATTSLQQLYPSVACTPSGRVAVAWCGLPDTGASRRVFLRERHPATGWDSTAEVSVEAVEHEKASVAVAENGDLAVVWLGREFGATSNQVFCRRRVAGAWQDVEFVSSVPGGLSQYAPGVALNGYGNVHVTWHGRSSMNFYQQVFCRRRGPAGWSGIDSVSRERSYQQQSPSVACDAAGRCHVSWAIQTGSSPAVYQVAYAQRDTDQTWTSPVILTSADSASVQNPSLACGPAGGIHIVWSDDVSGNNDVYYLRGVEQGAGVGDRGRGARDDGSGEVWIAPNPARTGYVDVRMPEGGMASLCDAAGRRLLDLRAGLNDLRPLSYGLYFVRAEAGLRGPGGTFKLVIGR